MATKRSKRLAEYYNLSSDTYWKGECKCGAGFYGRKFCDECGRAFKTEYRKVAFNKYLAELEASIAYALGETNKKLDNIKEN